MRAPQMVPAVSLGTNGTKGFSYLVIDHLDQEQKG
jgi:hypothetical protein